MKTFGQFFIGRKKELEFLDERYMASGGQLVIIYGRRRIGKTETIKHFCVDKQAVFFTCTLTDDKKQLRNFSSVVLQTGMPAGQYITEFQTWEQAFLALRDIPSTDGKKRIVVIDEFPYMVRENREIQSVMQKTWDTVLKSEDVMIILCGSAMSYMENEVLSEKNPLYGRATGIWKMQPMSYVDSAGFVPSYSEHDKVVVHSVSGGIPYYLSNFDDSCSLADNICNSVLKKGSVLYSEPEFLLRQELREPATYNTVIQAIAYGKTSFNEIQQATQIEKGKLSVYLKNLIELGVVSREFPIHSSMTSVQNSQRGFYKVRDLFFRFWYKFVFPNISALEFGDYRSVWTNLVESQLDAFVSFPFEDICIEWMRRQNSLGNLPFMVTQIGRWWSGDVEVDIVAMNGELSAVISGECKFRKSVCNSGDLRRHISKNLEKLKLKEGAVIYYYFFSFSGFSPDAEQFAEEKGITLVTGHDLFTVI
ncbi:MAG: ATP-binding protein [Sphaerochaetaceae bacterium]|nr:ATP-binding protein [Sphaerochaetaceae bacterium]